MRFHSFSIGLGLVAAIALFVGTAATEPPDPEFIKKVTTPGKHHEELGELIGEYDVKLEMVLPGYEMPPTKGTATFEWGIKGYWILQRLKGTLMGQPYEGLGIHGFDNHTKNYCSTWVSNMDTMMITTKGVIADPEGKIKTEYGTLNEYMSGEFNKPIKTVARIESKDKFVLEVWDLGIGEAGQAVLKYTYTRKKAE